MKISIACLIATFLVLSFVDFSEAGIGCPLRTVPPPTQPWSRCQPCGPGGRACPGCSDQPQLCEELLAQLKELEDQIRVCVCGQSRWLV
ncbi:salivary glue protein Sgs-7-like [Drosophila albomicans]|uniref:Salivary glue protein Sgs-7-like n=1 Tax=Drosophila albomicans TaxID=7291 RepID=A0A6P8XRG0_DROAB|nr:salivary glue protein Sgs-7-like [Drosophila albomicans]